MAVTCRGSWKTATYKKYNFEAEGIPTTGGALHPLLKVREEIRNIFLEMGCDYQSFNINHANNFQFCRNAYIILCRVRILVFRRVVRSSTTSCKRSARHLLSFRCTPMSSFFPHSVKFSCKTQRSPCPQTPNITNGYPRFMNTGAMVPQVTGLLGLKKNPENSCFEHIQRHLLPTCFTSLPLSVGVKYQKKIRRNSHMALAQQPQDLPARTTMVLDLQSCSASIEFSETRQWMLLIWPSSTRSRALSLTVI